MKSIFEIKETEIGRQMTDAELSRAASIDMSDIFTWIRTQVPSNGSGG